MDHSTTMSNDVFAMRKEAAERITLTLVNTEQNRSLLERVPHFEIGEFSAVPRWFLSESTSFVVTEEIGKRIGLSGNELLEIGRKNIERESFEIRPLTEIIKGLLTAEGMSQEDAERLYPGEGILPMLVMTNRKRLYGAAAILSRAALSEAYEMCRGSFYLLPSSIHEMICVPLSCGMDPGELRRIVHDVNQTELPPEEVLGYGIQLFDGNELSSI